MAAARNEQRLQNLSGHYINVNSLLRYSMRTAGGIYRKELASAKCHSSSLKSRSSASSMPSMRMAAFWASHQRNFFGHVDSLAFETFLARRGRFCARKPSLSSAAARRHRTSRLRRDAPGKRISAKSEINFEPASAVLRAIIIINIRSNRARRFILLKAARKSKQKEIDVFCLRGVYSSVTGSAAEMVCRCRPYGEVCCRVDKLHAKELE